MIKKVLILLCLIGISTAQAQTKEITGTVSDKHTTLPGVSISIKGSAKTVTSTDFDGKYKIKAKVGNVLVYSYLGYSTVEKTVGSANVINVTMKEASAVLDEIVVTAYGSSRVKRSASASVMSINGYHNNTSTRKKKKSKPAKQILQGSIAAAQMNSGQQSKVLIRGNNSVQRGRNPLYVVDGVPVPPEKFRKLKSEDVQSVSVLKDASATAIYGTRGVNGVVVVTTKTGRALVSDNESYKEIVENQFQVVQTSPLSTFSIDVDKAGYSNVRRMINNGYEVEPDAVKIEEMINYFDYDYPQPTNRHPFSINTEVVKTPWNNKTKLVRIGLQGKTYEEEKLPPSNLTFLIDVSGSMGDYNKLPLLKSAFKLLVNKLREQDRVSIVVYAGAAGVVLEPTSGNEKKKIMDALEELQSGGSTAGGEGIELAYKLAKENFIKKGNNRVILATDGDFNVGSSSDSDMEKLIVEKRKSGVFLSVLGFGYGNYKDSKLEVLADKGNGNHAYIDNMQEARKVFSQEFGGTLFTIAKDVKIQIEFNPQNVAAYRLIGYENRLLDDEDFVDDTIDAGELGSGHTVTALYEILPTGIKSDGIPNPIDLKYTTRLVNDYQDELFTVKFRYKKPNRNKSIEMVHVQKDETQETLSKDMNFAASVALFGMQLRESKFYNNAQLKDVIELAEAGKGVDKEGYRSEFIRLVKTYMTDF